MGGVTVRRVRAVAAGFLTALSLADFGFGDCAWGQTVAPVVVPFETANAQLFGGKFDRSIRGFLTFETDGIFGFLASFEDKTTNQRTNRAFQKFQDDASASVDEVPIPSGSVSVSYTYDPKLESFVRWQRPFSPALSLNARTDGRGILTLGASFSYLEYEKFDGQDRRQVVLPSAPVTAFGPDVVDVLLFQFKLRQRIYSLSVQYGLLDNLDVGMFLPVFDESFRGFVIDRFVVQNPDGSFTRLDARFNPLPPTKKVNRDFFNVFPGEVPNVGFFFREDRYGVGDLVLRSKALFGSGGNVDFGGALNVSLPTGDKDNLMGVGSVRVDPRLLMSVAGERYGVHVNYGVHVDFDESSRDRYDYSVGGEVLVAAWVTLLIDQVGRIEFQGQDKVSKFEIVPGVKVNPYKSVVLGFNAIVPINHEGLRTDFTPNASGEFSVAF